MSDGATWLTMSASVDFIPFDDNPLVQRRPMHDEAKFDITAMIDLVFMMNIFFLVTSVTAALAEIDLPDGQALCRLRSRHVGLDHDHAPASIAGRASVDRRRPRRASAGRGRSERAQDPRGGRGGSAGQQKDGLIKAEKNVQLRDVSRIGAVAVSVPGIELKLAVIEQE